MDRGEPGGSGSGATGGVVEISLFDTVSAGFTVGIGGRRSVLLLREPRR